MKSLAWFVGFAALLSVVAGDPSQCEGKCPAINPNDDVYLLPHKNCSMFCSCVYGKPVELPCPKGLHYSPKDRVCTYPSQAECAAGGNHPLMRGAFDLEDSLVDRYACLGTCPANDIPDVIVTLEHQDCGKFCKCVKGFAQERDCPIGFHFSPHLGVCTYPREAMCFRVTTTLAPTTQHDCCACPSTGTPSLEEVTTASTEPTPKPTESTTPPTKPTPKPTESTTPPTEPTPKPTESTTPPTEPTPKPTESTTPPTEPTPKPTESTTPPTKPTPKPTESTTPPTKPTPKPTESTIPSTEPSTTPKIVPDAGGCIGKCPPKDPADVVHLPHAYCSKFCKCSNGEPYLFNCQPGLYFNPKLQVCDLPIHSGCTGIKA